MCLEAAYRRISFWDDILLPIGPLTSKGLQSTNIACDLIASRVTFRYLRLFSKSPSVLAHVKVHAKETILGIRVHDVLCALFHQL